MDASSTAFRVGREISGPIYVPFLNWIAGHCERLKIDHVLFLARDGQLFWKIAQESAAFRKFRTHYFLAGSRSSWYCCTPYLVRAPVLEFRIASEFRTIRRTLNAFGIEPTTFPVRFNEDLDIDLSPQMIKGLATTLTGMEGRAALFELTGQARATFVDYLLHFGIVAGSKVALVDVGWNGNFQTAFESIVQPLRLAVVGFYFGLNNSPPGSSRYWFTYGPSRYPHWLRFYPCLLETLTPADHGSIKGLMRTKDGILPVVTGPPLANPDDIRNLHLGALSYARQSSSIGGKFDLKGLVESPPELLVEFLSTFSFQKPFASDELERFVRPHSVSEAVSLSLSLKRNLANWHWPQANLKISGLGFLGIGLTQRFQLGFLFASVKQKSVSILKKGWRLIKALLNRRSSWRDYDVISFDIFDTVLYRQCGHFAQIFEMLEQKARIPGLAQLRKETEARLLRVRAQEVTIEEIYAELSHIRTEIDWGYIKNLELECERDQLRLSKRAAKYLQKARSNKAKILFVSDMYLSSMWLREQLKKHKVWLPGDEIYVSCEAGANKRSGDLYIAIRKIYPGMRWLHLGDNLMFDIVNAHRFGVDSKWLPHSYQAAITHHLDRVLARFF